MAALAGSAAPAVRRRLFGDRLPELEGPLTLAQTLNRALADVLAQYPESLVFGEDVAQKGGVYGVTRGLRRKVGRARVFDTLLDEQSILGLALGAGVSGLLPIPEIQYLAYLHNAEDQLRGEAATLRFFSDGQFPNPMVVRLPGYGYQKGFGGHFHNDNAVGVLRDIPGLVIASPSRPDDAAAVLRTCVAAAKANGTVSVFLEPIALYHTRDLHEEDDGWLAPYSAPAAWAAGHAPIGRGRTHGDGRDLTIVTFGNGVPMSLRVARRLARGVTTRVLDLRWLAPLPVEDILREADVTGRVLVVDETRRSGGVSESVVTALVDGQFRGAIARVTSEDSFIPLGDAARQVLLSEETIEDAGLRLVAGRRLPTARGRPWSRPGDAPRTWSWPSPDPGPPRPQVSSTASSTTSNSLPERSSTSRWRRAPLPRASTCSSRDSTRWRSPERLSAGRTWSTRSAITSSAGRGRQSAGCTSTSAVPERAARHAASRSRAAGTAGAAFPARASRAAVSTRPRHSAAMSTASSARRHTSATRTSTVG